MRRLLLPAWLAFIPVATAADIGPLHFSCDDGTRFALVFHDGGTATLDLSGTPETLVQQPMGSGIVYAGPRHTYREHQGRSELEAKGGSPTACRQG